MENNSAGQEVKPRDIEHAPFAWQAKAALKAIRESLDGAHAVASGLSTYLALSEIASDEQSAEFTTTHSWVSLKSGLGVRTVWARLKDFERLKLIAVEASAWKGPAKYTLLTFGNGCDTSGNGCRRSRNRRKQASLLRSEESPKNHQRISKGGARSRKPPEMWQSHKDRKSLQEQIRELRASTKPDPELLAGLQAELKQVNDCIREFGKGKAGETVEAKPNPRNLQRVDRSIGTTNQGTAAKYRGLGKVDNPRNAGIAIDPIDQGKRAVEIVAARAMKAETPQTSPATNGKRAEDCSAEEWKAHCDKMRAVIPP